MRTHRGWQAAAVLAAVVVDLATSIGTASAQSNVGTRVMPLGDSITEGTQVPGGYRIGLRVVRGNQSVVRRLRCRRHDHQPRRRTQLWNGSYTQSGTQVTVANASYDGSVPSGASTSFGFNGSWTSTNPVPAEFTLNGVACV